MQEIYRLIKIYIIFRLELVIQDEIGYSARPLDAGWSSLVARRAHNPKVAGSNPAPATLKPAAFGRRLYVHPFGIRSRRCSGPKHSRPVDGRWRIRGLAREGWPSRGASRKTGARIPRRAARRRKAGRIFFRVAPVLLFGPGRRQVARAVRLR